MKSLLALVAIAVLAPTVAACGRTSKGHDPGSQSPSNAPTTESAPATTASSTTAVKRNAKNDIDGDSDNNNDDLLYGYSASAKEKQAVAVLVKRYYAAALAGDAPRACSMIYSLYAEEIPELYGEPPTGTPALRGNTCAEVLRKLFKQEHHQLAAEGLAKLKVTDVRVKRKHALVMLYFNKTSPQEIRIHREHRVWKIDELLAGGLG